MSDKKLDTVIIVVLLLAILGVNLYTMSIERFAPTEEAVVEPVKASDMVRTLPADKGTEQVWEDSIQPLRGAPLWGIEVGDLGVVTMKVADHGSVFKMIDRNTDEHFIFSCDAVTSTIQVGYSNGVVDNKHSDVNNFSIRQYKSGSKFVYEGDESRGAIFSTYEGHIYFQEFLNTIRSMPQDDLIALVLEHTDNDYSTHPVGWSVMFPVKQVVEFLDHADLSDCAQVNLVNPPSFIG